MVDSKRLVRAVTVAAVVAGLLTVPASAVESEQFPGLPEATGVQYAGTVVNALGASARAEQFFLVPNAVSAIDAAVSQVPVGPEVNAEFNAMPGPPGCEPTGGSILSTVSKVYPISPQNAPDPYGWLEPIRVRTVAFGSIPSEAVVTISLARDDENLPVPLVATQSDANCPAPLFRRYTDASVSGAVDVQITEASVDGISLRLDGDCRASAVLDLTGKGFRSGDPNVDRDDVYVAVSGGLLEGTLDLSNFSNCTTGAGEDISDLISGLLSGPANPISIRQGNLGACFPTGNAALCRAPEPFELP